jgi:hypothetical protein
MNRYHLLVATTLLALASTLPAQTPNPPQRTPVLVELFTSEGCSSCPPADALLLQLEREQPIPNADIIILGEHVDYWDNLGWHDRFSSAQYTQRQNQYGNRFNLNSVYTPQMVVDGATQFVGNDASRARSAIAHAAQPAKIPLTLSTPTPNGPRLTATVTLPTTSAALPKADLYAALVSPLETTSVRNGENGGRTLHHAGVVRSLQRIGSLQDLASNPITFSLNTPSSSPTTNPRIVVFAQLSGQGPILAAATTHN